MSTTPTFTRPASRSLSDYIGWIKAVTSSVGGSTVDDPVKDSPEVWRRDHEEFWRLVDETAARHAG
jgi:hypothetical protein